MSEWDSIPSGLSREFEATSESLCSQKVFEVVNKEVVIYSTYI